MPSDIINFSPLRCLRDDGHLAVADLCRIDAEPADRDSAGKTDACQDQLPPRSDSDGRALNGRLQLPDSDGATRPGDGRLAGGAWNLLGLVSPNDVGTDAMRLRDRHVAGPDRRAIRRCKPSDPDRRVVLDAAHARGLPGPHGRPRRLARGLEPNFAVDRDSSSHIDRRAARQASARPVGHILGSLHRTPRPVHLPPDHAALDRKDGRVNGGVRRSLFVVRRSSL